VAANVVTVVVLHMGVIGILTGNLVAAFAIWCILTVNTIRNCGWRVQLGRLRPVLRYGYPLMLSGLAAAVIGSSDRYVLKLSASVAAVGVYALGLRLATVIPILVVTPFTQSFGPFRFSIMKRPDASDIFAKVLTIFVLIGCAAALGLSLFAGEIVHLVSSKEYADAGVIVPLLLVPGVLGGVGYVFQTGIYIQKQTKQIFWITVVAGVAALLLNLLLIPRFHAFGAALAGTLTALGGVWLTYVTAQKVSPIEYDLPRSLRIAGIALLLGIAAASVAPAGAWGWAVKSAAMLAFVPLGLWAGGLSVSQMRLPWRVASEPANLSPLVASETTPEEPT